MLVQFVDLLLEIAHNFLNFRLLGNGLVFDLRNDFAVFFQLLLKLFDDGANLLGLILFLLLLNSVNLVLQLFELLSEVGVDVFDLFLDGRYLTLDLVFEVIAIENFLNLFFD